MGKKWIYLKYTRKTSQVFTTRTLTYEVKDLNRAHPATLVDARHSKRLYSRQAALMQKVLSKAKSIQT